MSLKRNRSLFFFPLKSTNGIPQSQHFFFFSFWGRGRVGEQLVLLCWQHGERWRGEVLSLGSAWVSCRAAGLSASRNGTAPAWALGSRAMWSCGKDRPVARLWDISETANYPQPIHQRAWLASCFHRQKSQHLTHPTLLVLLLLFYFCWLGFVVGFFPSHRWDSSGAQMFAGRGAHFAENTLFEKHSGNRRTVKCPRCSTTCVDGGRGCAGSPCPSGTAQGRLQAGQGCMGSPGCSAGLMSCPQLPLQKAHTGRISSGGKGGQWFLVS